MSNRPGGRGAYFFNSMAGAEYLAMSPRTFRRHVRHLGIQPRRMYPRKGKSFIFADLEKIADVFAPLAHVYVKYLGKRIDTCMREIREIKEKKR